MGHLIAKFIVVYGHDAWYNKDRWGKLTGDGIIPFKLFLLMIGSLESVMAAEQLQEAQGIAQGIAMAFADKKQMHKVKDSMKKLHKIGYPIGNV